VMGRVRIVVFLDSTRWIHIRLVFVLYSFGIRDDKHIRACGYLRIKSAMDSYYPRVAAILIPAYKRVGYGYHIIRTRGYPLPAKN